MSLFSKKAAEGGREGAKSGYGINEATLLMRTLPVDQNVELVVRVIRSTLESMNVQLPSIIEDAEAKQHGLQERMGLLNGEITAFAQQIEQRRQEIATLEAELAETTTVKERLCLAQDLATQPAPRATAAVPVTPPLPTPPRLNGKGAPEFQAR
jgi:predicted RNase H-like nuclease (RuvC/YqgF family)